jgi:ribose 5-phosphate isomerase RpiB
MTLGARFVAPAALPEMLAAFLGTHCREDRHLRRVQKIMQIEEQGR